MLQSEQTEALNAALVKAQSGMKPVVFDSTNPHFKNKYASLPAVIGAILPALNANGISVTQTTELRQGAFVLVTTLRHTSGQWVAGEYLLPQVSRPQEMGSAITYAKRYALSAMVCIAADEDDDAEGARKDNQVAEMPKRDNPHVSRLEDMTDRRYRTDAKGKRIDWIDTSMHRVPHLTGEKAKALYKTLKTAMRMCNSVDDLVEWGIEHAEQVAQLGKTEDYFQLIEYQEYLDELRHKEKRAA